jgi:hypothetical protein
VCGVQYNDPKFRQTRTQNKNECLKMLAIHSINCYSLLLRVCIYIYIVTPNSLHDIPMLYVIPLAINSTNSQRDCILLIHYILSIWINNIYIYILIYIYTYIQICKYIYMCVCMWYLYIFFPLMVGVLLSSVPFFWSTADELSTELLRTLWPHTNRGLDRITKNWRTG